MHHLEFTLKLNKQQFECMKQRGSGKYQRFISRTCVFQAFFWSPDLFESLEVHISDLSFSPVCWSCCAWRQAQCFPSPPSSNTRLMGDWWSVKTTVSSVKTTGASFAFFGNYETGANHSVGRPRDITCIKSCDTLKQQRIKWQSSVWSLLP